VHTGKGRRRGPALQIAAGAFRLLPCVPPCPVFSQLHADEDGEAPREPVFLQVMGSGAGWDEETEKKLNNNVHSPATNQSSSALPSRPTSPPFPIYLAALHRAPPGARTAPPCRQPPSTTTLDPPLTRTTPPERATPCSSHTDDTPPQKGAQIRGQFGRGRRLRRAPPGA